MSKFIGDKAFYRKTFNVMLPILAQSVITNFVNLLDNVMVGRLGTEQVSGVAVINELIFVFNICVFGCASGADIFTAQFFGKRDIEGVRNSFRMKLFFLMTNFLLFFSAFTLFGDKLIMFYLHEGSSEVDLQLVFGYAKKYLSIAAFQLLPFSVVQLYSGTLKACGETLVPMIASATAVGTNAVLNYILIFGKLGIEPMGVTGAAIATVIAKITEMLIVVIWSHRHTDRAEFVPDLYRTLKVPKSLAKMIVRMALPLIANETMWSIGTTLQTQSYSTRGADVVAAISIAYTISDLFTCAVYAMGNSVGIFVGHRLGAGELKEAVEDDNKLIALSVALCTCLAVIMVILAPYIPRIYNTTDTVKELAKTMLIICAVMTPINAFIHGCYMTLRSGGKILYTMIFDSFFVWGVLVPAALIISRLTSLPIVPMFAIIQGLNFVKAVIGFILVKKKVWVNNLVG